MSLLVVGNSKPNGEGDTEGKCNKCGERVFIPPEALAILSELSDVRQGYSCMACAMKITINEAIRDQDG